MTDKQRHTGVTAASNDAGLRDAYGNKPLNVWRIEVIGNRGEFHGVRATLAEARATARHYARVFDAPHAVI